jgi:uncharacterized protein (TIGR00255 family)
MTGYGQASAESGRFRVAVSVRSVNHRFLDLAIRLADELRDLEPAIRKAVDARLHRGRVDLRLAVERLGEEAAAVHVDPQVVRDLVAATRDLGIPGLDARPLALADLLRVPEVVRVRRLSLELEDAEQEWIVGVVDEALRRLVDARETEGGQLATVLDARLRSLEELVERLSAVRGEVRARLVAGMRQRLAELIEGSELPAERVLQESAVLAEKIDVQEELDRLAAHLETFRDTMGSAGALGRRLDFLAQEIHRELNTLGVKCRDARMAEWVIDGKVVCEQLREQVQNVE